MKNSNNIAIVGIFSALIAVTTAFVKIPIAQGYYHLGLALMLILTLKLSKRNCLAISLIGFGLADIIAGYINYMFFTIIIYGLCIFLFLLTKNKGIKILSLLIIPVGYFFVNSLFYGISGGIANIGWDFLQVTLSYTIYIIIKPKLNFT